MEYLKSEAGRCLKCKQAKCKKSCPIDTPVPEVIELFEKGEIREAGKVLFDNNPLTAICAIVCPHENQCKGNCVRGIKGEPVSFCEIEQFISLKYLKELTIEKEESKGKKIAVIGSGPAGITGALLLAKKGYQVTIFEMRDKIGGVLTYGIPEFRLPKSIVYDLENKLRQLGVYIKPNTIVGPVITMDKLLEDGYDAVFVATGVWAPKMLSIKGETLGHSCYAIDYLKNPTAYKMGERVCVIGAGNVAMDAARSAKYYGAKEVFICYRRDMEDMTATKAEIAETMEDGVEFHFYKSPVEITDEGVVFSKTEKYQNEDGTMVLRTVSDSNELFPCDNVIIAVSQSPQSNIIYGSPDLLTKYGLLVTDEFGHTTKKGIFACGDVVSGAKTVIEAVVAAKKVAESIERFLEDEN